MSSLSAALNSSAIDINDAAVWDRVAAHFREKLGRMASTADAPKTNVFNGRVASVKSPKRYDCSLLPTLGPIMMNALLGISLITNEEKLCSIS
jgi:hypothetical protein